MAYEERKYTPEEIERGKYVCDKIFKLIARGPFSMMFDTLAGILFGYAAANGMSTVETVERIGWLTSHDSPDGRTSEELLAAFAKGKAS
jgi:hypothetical protein